MSFHRQLCLKRILIKPIPDYKINELLSETLFEVGKVSKYPEKRPKEYERFQKVEFESGVFYKYCEGFFILFSFVRLYSFLVEVKYITFNRDICNVLLFDQ